MLHLRDQVHGAVLVAVPQPPAGLVAPDGVGHLPQRAVRPEPHLLCCRERWWERAVGRTPGRPVSLVHDAVVPSCKAALTAGPVVASGLAAGEYGCSRATGSGFGWSLRGMNNI